MEKYKVIDPKGIHIAGVPVKKGEDAMLGKGAELNAFLHFKQVEKVEDKPAKKASDS